MKILILGSSSETVLPRMKGGRLLGSAVELSRDEKDRRTRASIAIKLPSEEAYLLVDPTPDYWYQITRANIEIKAIVITSSKSHHSQGVYQHYLPILTFASRQHWNDLVDAKIPLNYRRTIDKPIISLHGLKIFPFDITHQAVTSEEEKETNRSFGLRIFDEVSNQTLVYIPDLLKVPTRSRQLASNADLMLLDGATYEKTYNEHRPIKQWLNYLETSITPQNLWFIGMGQDALPHKELKKKIKEKFENSGVCYDGLEIELINGKVNTNE